MELPGGTSNVEAIPGHSLWLDPPEDKSHYDICPANPDYEFYDENAPCECDEIARDAAADIGDRRNKEEKEG